MNDSDKSRSAETDDSLLQHSNPSYTIFEFFENWSDSFSFYELVVNENGKEDLKILEVNKTFADLISADPHMLSGQLFTAACPMALDWLPLYIDIAKKGGSTLYESYNQDLKKYLSALAFSPRIGHVALLVVDRTQLWKRDQELIEKNADLSVLFSSMTTGFCVGKIIRDPQGKPVDAILEMVNAAFELLEGVSTASLQGRRLLNVLNDEETFLRYVDVVDNKSKITFTKHVEINNFTLEVICFSQSDDVFVCIENNISDRIKAEGELQKASAIIEQQNATLISSMEYASKIQKNLLPTESTLRAAFSDYSIIWSPKDVVGGDIYWLRNFPQGTVLCVCDCTGHGIPGALLTMLVASTLDIVVNEDNCSNPAQIILELDTRISTILNASDLRSSGKNDSIMTINDGCDLAVLFISKDRSVAFSSSGIPVFTCDGNEVKRYRAQQLHIGDGLLTDPLVVKTTVVPYGKEKFYIASDGLFDQIGGEKKLSFGYRSFKDVILNNYNKRQDVVANQLWKAFETHRGDNIRRDDVELVAFRP